MSKIVCDAPSKATHRVDAWTPTDDAALTKLTGEGKTDSQIASEIGRTASAVERRRSKIALTKPSTRDWPEEKIANLRKLWSAGHSCAQIAARLGGGTTRNAVIGKANRLGLEGRAAPTSPGASRLAGALRRARTGAEKSRKVNTIKPPRKAAPGPRLGPGFSTVEQPPAIAPDEAFQPLPGDTHRPWEDRGPRQCKWPLDVDGQVFSCCRHEARAGYCESHFALGFRADKAASAKEYNRGLRKWAA